MRPAIRLVFVLFLFGMGMPAAGRSRPRLKQQDFIWHWNLAYGFSKIDLDRMWALNIRGVFLRAGDFRVSDDKTTHFEPLSFNSDSLNDVRRLDRFQVHLVFSYGPGYGRALVAGREAEAAKEFFLYADHMISLLQGLGVSVEGIQIDLENAVNLESYRRYLEPIIARYSSTRLVSIDPWAYWIRRDGYRKLVSGLDFVVPMFYDRFRSKNVDGKLEVSSAQWAAHMVKMYCAGTMPFYAGIPVYSYSILYDAGGQMKTSWLGMSENALSEREDFELVSSRFRTDDAGVQMTNADYQVWFRAAKDTSIGYLNVEKGSIVRIDHMSSAAVASISSAVKAARGPMCLGNAYFRYAHLESMVLGIEKINASGPAVDEVPKILADAWYYRIGHGKGSKTGVVFKLVNVSRFRSVTEQNGSGIRIYFENLRVVSSDRGRFDVARTGNDGQTLLLSEKQLAPGEAVFSGPVILKAAGTGKRRIRFEGFSKGLFAAKPSNRLARDPSQPGHMHVITIAE